MIVINKEQVSLHDNCLVTEASSAGLRPGEWPDFVSVINDEGNGFLFGPLFKPLSDGGRVYLSKSNLELHILND